MLASGSGRRWCWLVQKFWTADGHSIVSIGLRETVECARALLDLTEFYLLLLSVWAPDIHAGTLHMGIECLCQMHSLHVVAVACYCCQCLNHWACSFFCWEGHFVKSVSVREEGMEERRVSLSWSGTVQYTLFGIAFFFWPSKGCCCMLPAWVMDRSF